MKKDDWKESGGITLENAAKGAVTCEENTCKRSVLAERAN